MKKLILSMLALVFISIYSQAQFTKGQKLLGGSLGFSSNNFGSNTSSSNSTSFNLNPSYGVFQNEKSLITYGMNFGLTNSSRNPYSPYSNDNTKSLGLFIAKQRFEPIAKNFYFTVSGNVNCTYSHRSAETTANYQHIQEVFQIGFGIMPGLSYKLNNRFLFDLSIGNLISTNYSYISYTDKSPNAPDSKSHENSFGLSSSLSNTNLGSLSFGVRIFLNNKTKG